jgi:hypothetical protein
MSTTTPAALVPIGVPHRRPESPADTLAGYRASGLTQRAFCEQIGLPVSTLQWWLVRARRQARAGHPVTFAEIPMPVAPPASGPSWAVEIVTATGVTVRLREPLRGTAVRTLLRGRRC